MSDSESKIITIPCRSYFEQRLMFFLNAKYFSNRPLTEEEADLCDQSIMRATVEFRGFEIAIEMFEKEGYTVVIEERKFMPVLKSNPPNTNVVEPESPEAISADEEDL